MGTRRNPRFKECRRLGLNVCGHPKAMKRAGNVAFKKKGKQSDYGLQLTEKQKIKAYYGIFERQLKNYYKKAKSKQGKTSDVLFEMLECRLDNLVYRIGFGNSIRLSRQLVSHGHILVDGKKINIPSQIIKPGQTIALKAKSVQVDLFKNNFLQSAKIILPYVEKDESNFSGKLVRLPARNEIPVDVNDQLVIEFYAR